MIHVEEPHRKMLIADLIDCLSERDSSIGSCLMTPAMVQSMGYSGERCSELRQARLVLVETYYAGLPDLLKE